MNTKAKEKKVSLSPESVTLDMVKVAVFGCNNCLWSGCECRDYSKFSPAVYKGKPTCKAYTYYD